MARTSLIFNSPIGWLSLEAEQDELTQISFLDHEPLEMGKGSPFLRVVQKELKEYFAGKRKVFSKQVLGKGTSFQKNVWRALQQIPYGQTWSYSDLAKAVQNQKAVRAVGSANGKNPLPILVPCHRVIQKDGSLGGFTGGLWRKKKLLEIEGAL